MPIMKRLKNMAKIENIIDKETKEKLKYFSLKDNQKKSSSIKSLEKRIEKQAEQGIVKRASSKQDLLEPSTKVDANISSNIDKRNNGVPLANKMKAFNPDKASDFLKRNRGKIGLGSLGVGLAIAAIDKEDDNLESTVIKGAKTAAIGTGMAIASEKLFKTETVQNLIKGEILNVSESVKENISAKSKAFKAGSFLPTASLIGTVGVGIASLLDIGGALKDKATESKLKREAEARIKAQDNRQREMYKKDSYDYIDQGEILFELFEGRSGHHKMGNSRFN